MADTINKIILKRIIKNEGLSGKEYFYPKTSLDQIDEINITSITDNQILTYDSTSSKWINSDKDKNITFRRW